MVEIIDIHKLGDDMGDKTVAVDAFEGNNLVLIDEGHRGAASGSDGPWMRYRNALCAKGFSYEYSATFAQAVKGSAAMTDLYAKAILVDYSYRWFYGDGFGKDYQILNLDEDSDEQYRQTYLIACLLFFVQQRHLHRHHGPAYRPFQIEPPLWVFVGGSVTAALSKDDQTDIIEILQFVDRYLRDRRDSIERIGQVLSRGIRTDKGRDLFAGRFSALIASGLSAEQLYAASLDLVFNAPGGGTLWVEKVDGAAGEIALRVADRDPFGVINVGDDAKLVKLCEDKGLQTRVSTFGESLFHGINTAESTISLLIGSRKFSEGWSSWRVSTMGLMNIGRSEGAQIIQLFGRGVRLKGYAHSLKRSGRAQLADGIPRPPHLSILETLAIFGVRADYMAQFREFLEDEGLAPNDEQVELLLPVITNLGTQVLKMPRLKAAVQGASTGAAEAFRGSALFRMGRYQPSPSSAVPCAAARHRLAVTAPAPWWAPSLVGRGGRPTCRRASPRRTAARRAGLAADLRPGAPLAHRQRRGR